MGARQPPNKTNRMTLALHFTLNFQKFQNSCSGRVEVCSQKMGKGASFLASGDFDYAAGVVAKMVQGPYVQGDTVSFPIVKVHICPYVVLSVTAFLHMFKVRPQHITCSVQKS